MRTILFHFVVLVLVVSVFFPRESNAETYAHDMQECQQAYAFTSSQGGFLTPLGPCTVVYPDSNHPTAPFVGFNSQGNGWYLYGPFSDSPPSTSNPCSTVWSTPGIAPVEGKILSGSSMCQPGTPASNGATPMCGVTITPTGPPILDGSTGKWNTVVTVSGTGSICGADPAPKDPNGNDYNPSPNVPLQPVVNVTAPVIKGDGASYDPNTQNFCANSGSPCIPNASVSNGGACNTVGDITLCVGTPNSPAPSKTTVPDPPTEVQSTDNFKQADPATGSVIPVAATIYSTGSPTPGGAGTTNPGSSSTPSSSSSSSTPPASSSSAGKGGSYGGGGDCNSPPSCSGDAVMCGVVQQTWYVRCGASLSDKNGNGQPDWTEVGASDNAAYAVTPAGNSDVFTSKTVDPSTINQTSWAGNTCPALPSAKTEFAELVFGDQDWFCGWLAAIRAIVLIAGSFISVRILAGSQS